ncbi:MAG: type II toxin-antitoxin system RelE/ParE family toxin [bacterium]|nr:type II toxin-antitoxin system RelE/ParE family toxin [bacterium]
MKLFFTERALDDYHALSTIVRRLADKQLDFLVKNLRHPSLKAKKYDEGRGVWQARITRDYRTYFLIDEDRYVILAVTKHPK